MQRRIPGSMRTLHESSDLIERKLSSPDARDQLVGLGTRLIAKETLEAKTRDILGRGYCEHGGEPGPRRWSRNRTDRLRTPEGVIVGTAPQGANRKRLWEGYPEFSERDLGKHDVAYMFVDGFAERFRPSQRRKPVLAAWGTTSQGPKVLFCLKFCSKEDHETAFAFLQDWKNRNLGEPLLVISNGAAGIIKATETCISRSEHRHCLAHRMRNFACKVLKDLWPGFKVRALAAQQSPSRAIGRLTALNTGRARCACTATAGSGISGD